MKLTRVLSKSGDSLCAGFVSFCNVEMWRIFIRIFDIFKMEDRSKKEMKIEKRFFLFKIIKKKSINI